jgi:hypothetical protein
MTERRFPPPWSIEELDACYVVREIAFRLVLQLELVPCLLRRCAPAVRREAEEDWGK